MKGKWVPAWCHLQPAPPALAALTDQGCYELGDRVSSPRRVSVPCAPSGTCVCAPAWKGLTPGFSELINLQETWGRERSRRAPGVCGGWGEAIFPVRGRPRTQCKSWNASSSLILLFPDCGQSRYRVKLCDSVGFPRSGWMWGNKCSV